MLIAGDIGGTKTELALYSTEAGPHAPLAQTKVRSADYPSLEAIVNEFSAKTQKPIDRACFAVAGPVIGGRVKTTNLPWMVDEGALAEDLNLNRQAVHLINDLEAVARAIPILRPSDVVTISPGEPAYKGAIAVIAPGTGLGESYLTWEETRYIAHSSEGGHADFAPTDDRQIRLLEYMFKTFDHVSFEHVCSGIGIPHLYRFLRDVEHVPEKPETAKLIDSAVDPSVIIIEEAVSSPYPSQLCVETIQMFTTILAAEAGNLAVKFLATGGVYVSGGVAVHTLPRIKDPAFLQRFRRKGRFADLMARIPIHVVISHAGLAGAAACGLEV
jgi:glucokinase